jgi:L-alanine-DL-glutamate epimerase-like enolase superfamily enzyme
MCEDNSMLASHLSLVRTRLELAHTFRIARSADEYRESVIVRLEALGLEALGEAAPSPRYEQSAASAERALASLPASLLEAPERIDETLDEASRILGPEKAALAALDMALHDFLGKRRGVPLHRLLGLEATRTPLTCYTIGIDTPAIIEQKIREAEDFPVLKIKMGLENDREIIRTVRRLTDRPIRVDVNEGWTREEAIEKLSWLENENVELVEQPLPADDLEGVRLLAGRTSIPLFADESVQSLQDIDACAGKYHGINIKLMKCGGIREALRLISAAREHGMKIMLGCMIESSIGITAAAQISPLVDYADLDGNILIRNDPAVGVTTHAGRLILPESPGLGVTLREGPVRNALKGISR